MALAVVKTLDDELANSWLHCTALFYAVCVTLRSLGVSASLCNECFSDWGRLKRKRSCPYPVKILSFRVCLSVCTFILITGLD